MRYHDLIEATPSTALQAQRFYHGTQSKKAADNIMRVGLHPGMKTSYKGDLRPAQDRVYLTTDLYVALVHALGPHYRTKMANTFPPDLANGYIFVVYGKDLIDVDPDEDEIGHFLWMYSGGRPHLNQPTFDDHHDPEPEVRRQVWQFIIDHGRPSDIRDSLIVGPKRPGAWASLGKTMHPIMPDWMKAKLIEWGASIAHSGPIKPSECWKIDRTDLWKLEGVNNLFEIAKRVF